MRSARVVLNTPQTQNRAIARAASAGVRRFSLTQSTIFFAKLADMLPWPHVVESGPDRADWNAIATGHALPGINPHCPLLSRGGAAVNAQMRLMHTGAQPRSSASYAATENPCDLGALSLVPFQLFMTTSRNSQPTSRTKYHLPFSRH